MLTKQDQELIEATVAATIRQLKRAGMLKPASDTEYKEITDRLRRFYDGGEEDPDIKAAVATVKQDKYYKVIPLYFSYHYTIEEIAEAFDVEVCTISRNKKRLSLKISEMLK